MALYPKADGGDTDGDSIVSDPTDLSTTSHPTKKKSTKNAWARVSATIRKVDGERVKDCKEDIDTILVFAGLYSAVLTALLVESYKTLTQDPQGIMIVLLQQLLSQTNSFVINDGVITSTIPRSNPIPHFTPSLYAQRVNILWFASLTLSLMSASFSIVVKQWLREFLAREYSSPRAHLRIRHFRNPGLSTYKVFEIAAFLPLLLQLSLLLFFVGLCFFTAGVHESIGNTTLPLVAAWGFLFLATSLVPVVDPKCPYKVPILRSPINAARKLLQSQYGKLRKKLRTVSEGKNIRTDGEGYNTVAGETKVVSVEDHHEHDRAQATHEYVPSSHRDPSQDVITPNAGSAIGQQSPTPRDPNAISFEYHTIHRVSPLDTPGSKPDGLGKDVHTTLQVSASTTPSAHSGEDIITYDEEFVAHDDTKDVAILVDALKVDAVQADDELLKDIILEALQQPSIPLIQLYELPFAVLDYRLQPDITKELANNFIDMSRLSSVAYETISYMFASLVKENLGSLNAVPNGDSSRDITRSKEQARPPGSDTKESLENSICALLSHAAFDHSDDVNEILHTCLRTTNTPQFHLPKLIRSRIQNQDGITSLEPVLRRLKGAFMKERDTKTLLDIIRDILQEFATQASASNANAPDPNIPKRRTVVLPPESENCKMFLKDLLAQRIEYDPDDPGSIETILHIDALLLDDDLLQGDMWNTLCRAKPDATTLVNFIVEAIANRTHINISASIEDSRLPDLTTLEQTSYNALLQLTAEVIVPETRKEVSIVPGAKVKRRHSHGSSGKPKPTVTLSVDPDADACSKTTTVTPTGKKRPWDPSLKPAICILLSRRPDDDVFDHSNLNAVNRALRQCLSTEFRGPTAKIIRTEYAGSLNKEGQDRGQFSGAAAALSRLCGGVALADNAADLIQFLCVLFPDDSSGPSVDRPDVKSNPLDAKYQIPSPFHEVVIDLFISWITGERQYTSEGPYIFAEMFRLAGADATEGQAKVIQVVKRILATGSIPKSTLEPKQLGMASGDAEALSMNAETVCNIALTTNANWTREISNMAQNIVITAAVGASTTDEITQILLCLVKYGIRLANVPLLPRPKTVTGPISATQPPALDPLLVCSFYLHLLNDLPPRSHRIGIYQHWKQLFDPLLLWLRKHEQEDNYRSSQYRSTAESCLKYIRDIKDTFNSRNLQLPFAFKEFSSLLAKILASVNRAVKEDKLAQYLNVAMTVTQAVDSTIPRP